MKKTEIKVKNLKGTIEITEDVEIVVRYIGKGEDSFSSKVAFIHRKPNLRSKISIKAVMYDRSQFDLEALLKIDKGAQNTDAYLKIDCLLLGDDATARAVPSLEINEDEVKGGHGATIGHLDYEQLYYLKSKGLSSLEAQEMLVEAFLS